MKPSNSILPLLPLLAAILLSPAPAVADSRRSLHQPFFPIQWSPPPPVSLPPPQAAATAAAATDGPTTARSSSTKLNTVAIASTASLVALAVVSYSCFLLLRRRGDEAKPRSPKHVAAAAAAGSDGPSSFRRHRSPPPSSVASEDIYIEPLAAVSSPPALERRQPSPELRPLPPLARKPLPAPRALPPVSTTATMSSDDDTYVTAPKTVKSVAYSQGTSQRSIGEPTNQRPPPPPPPISTTATMSSDDETYVTAPKTVKSVAYSPSPSQRSNGEPTNQRPAPPPPPPLPPLPPRRRLVRPLPAQSTSPLADLPLTNSASSIQDGKNPEVGEANDQELKPPSLKPLHWDKLKAISGRNTVWDQLKKSNSFRVDEEMMESLFLNNSNEAAGNHDKKPMSRQQESRVLDPKRLQNIAILLKALNVTAAEVTRPLLDGNSEDLGPEFFETLAKMAPTKEEELKLRDYSGDLAKLDPAERFLKAVLDVPFAFKRVDAMLCRANFDAEVNYLRKSFETLEAACEDLRSSKLFLKLLEAVLKTGNRMNDGTNRGEAKAFKLDTLLKLADIKATDGKMTLLHFVVQEIIRSEGLDSDQMATNHPSVAASDEQFKKHGLKVLAGLSTELANVKKAAALEMDALSSNVSKLETDLEKVRLVLQLEETCSGGSSEKFFETMNAFLRKAEGEIENVRAAEKTAMEHVKETAEFFHGSVHEEEAHPLRIFVVVRDFLAILDRVCKDVGRTPERVMMGSGKSFRVTPSASVPVRRYEPRRETSSDEDSSSS